MREFSVRVCVLKPQSFQTVLPVECFDVVIFNRRKVD